MENAIPSSSTPNSEFLDPKKKLEIESWLEGSKIVDLLVSSLTINLHYGKMRNPSSFTPNSEVSDSYEIVKLSSCFEDSKFVDPLVSSDDVEYFDTFLTLEGLGYHEWLLKYPKPSWVKAKIRTGNLNNIKISCMIGHFLKRQAYIDLESPINVMSKQHYKWIMSKGLELYLMRRSLEVLRKFQRTILGGRFNQLSHVSSPLLSKPGEY
ncbi:hypothetical protein Tco_0660955 [Tanacetum coccineum]